ncbi:MAG: XRE family transcriptional regulator, partial [Chryseobacterium artocarpi]
IFVTLNDGISYKRFTARQSKSITVAADNPFYEPYDIPLEEIVEVWQYASGIFPEDFEPEHLENYNIKEMFLEIRKNIQILDEKFSKAN